MGKNKRTVFERPWFTIEEEDYDDLPHLEGKPICRIVAPDSVLMCACTDDNKIVFVRQFRPVLDAYMIELPAGAVDSGEYFVDAAARELYEETGYTCDMLTFVSNCALSTSRIKGNVYLYFGNNARQDPRYASKEGTEAVLLNAEELKAKVDSGEFRMIPALGALLLVKWKLSPKELRDL